MFVTTCVAGTISVVTPFQAMQRPFIRDVTFYLVLVYWTFTVLWRGYMYAIEAIGEFQAHCTFRSTRFEMKPEGGISNVFLTNFYEGVNENLGVERYYQKPNLLTNRALTIRN